MNETFLGIIGMQHGIDNRLAQDGEWML